MWLWTLPSESKPHRWSVRPSRSAVRIAWSSTSLRKKAPVSIAFAMRITSWYITRPAPIVRWPTSELPITPGARPTASPEALSSVWAWVRYRRSIVGVGAIAIALASRSARKPHPSKITSTATGGRLVVPLIARLRHRDETPRLPAMTRDRPAPPRCAAAPPPGDAQQAMVFGGAPAGAHRAGLNLPCAGCDGEVGDRRVLGLARAMGDDEGEARRARHLDGLERFAERADLVELDQN